MGPLWHLVIVLLVAGAGSLSAAQNSRLDFLTWPDYIDPKLIVEFEQRYRVDVVEHYFTSDQHRTSVLETNAGEGYDVILVAGSYLRSYALRGWITALSEELIPTSRGIDLHWRNAFAGSSRYGLPYMWGTTGIAYRSDLISKPLTSWMELLQPAEELQGYVQMTGDTQELLQTALIALGYSINSEDTQELQQAKKLLIEQRAYVAQYKYSSNVNESLLLDGRARAAFSYSGDALMLQELNPAIHFVVPAEGSHVWGDYLTISAQTKNILLPHLFLNFINQPEHAARNAAYLHSATPNLEAKALLPVEMQNNALIYPSEAKLQNAEFSRWSNREATSWLKEFRKQLFGQ